MNSVDKHVAYVNRKKRPAAEILAEVKAASARRATKRLRTILTNIEKKRIAHCVALRVLSKEQEQVMSEYEKGNIF